MNKNNILLILIPILISVIFVYVYYSTTHIVGDSDIEETKNIITKVSALKEGNNQFSLDFYSEIIKENNDNVFFSPLSILTAFAILNEGAKGETSAELVDVFGFPDDELKRRISISAIHELINQQNPSYDLKMANALWIAENQHILPEYIDVVKTHYGSQVSNVDFGKSQTLDMMNNWVSKNTNGKIEKLFDSLSSDSSLTITNAIYFKGIWELQFDKQLTQDMTFRLDSQDYVTTPTMQIPKTTVMHANNEQVEMLELPYDGGRISMLLLLPHDTDGLKTLEESLTMKKINKLKNDLTEKELAVWLPKFSMDVDYELIPFLKNLGVSSAFSNADFSGITGSKGLFVDQAIHKAFVDVNEEGTEAVAVTAISMRESRSPGFYATHPFIFIIQDNETENILFMGRVVDPTK